MHCLVVALALIPEGISFSIIAGVAPAIGLFASFTMAVILSIVGGRQAMITAGDPGRAGGGEADAVHPAVGDGRLRQRAGDPDLLGPGPRDAGRAVGGVSADRRRPGADGVLPEDHHRDPGAAGLHRDPDRDHRRRGHRGADRRRQGRPALLPCRSPAPRRARHPDDDRPLRVRHGAGRPHGVADDRQAGRRHHRHPLEQDPRVDRPGHRQHRHRLLRRHGRLRRDRPDDDQREGLRRPHPPVHLSGRRLA